MCSYLCYDQKWKSYRQNDGICSIIIFFRIPLKFPLLTRNPVIMSLLLHEINDLKSITDLRSKTENHAKNISSICISCLNRKMNASLKIQKYFEIFLYFSLLWLKHPKPMLISQKRQKIKFLAKNFDLVFGVCKQGFQKLSKI